jgi:hypothetical protein
MSKICTPSPPMRKRRVMKRTSIMETSRLEEKLDGIATLLKSATQGAPVGALNIPLESGSSSRGGVSEAAVVTDFSHHEHTYARQIPSVHDTGHCPTPIASPSSSSKSTLVNCQPPLLHPSLVPSPEDAELFLNKFRTDFAKHVPFIVISPSITSYQLCQERPILWVCVMTVACNNSTRQIALSNEVRAIFGREAFVKGTKSMDLLLGILVYATWYEAFLDRQPYSIKTRETMPANYFSCFRDLHHSMDRPIYVTLLQVALAILYELGLDKPAPNDQGLILANDMKGLRSLSRSPTMEERRVWFGCFLMISR